MFYVTDDPIADFNRWDAEQQAKLDKLPKCAECGEPIQSEECYELDCGVICPECLEDNHKHWVEDFMD